MFCLLCRRSPIFWYPVSYLQGRFSRMWGRGGWLATPLFIAHSAAASMQAHHFMYGVSYRCHPVSCLSDVSLLYKIDIPVPDRI